MRTLRTLTILLACGAALTALTAEARRAADPAVQAPQSKRTAAARQSDDPASGMYKKAYEMILKERWDEARKALRELAGKYPSSEYRDDAEYWIAYSWRESDADRAMKAYRDFLRNYRESSYFDDALADLDQMMARSMAVAAAAPAAPAAHAPPALMVLPDDSMLSVTIRSLPAPAIAPMMKMRHLSRTLGTPAPRVAFGGMYELDEETRLRIEALYAVGRTGEDAKGFDALRSLAVSPRERIAVRVAAMETLAGYRKHDAMPVFIEIARNDTSEEMQLYAIESIGSAARDRGKAFDALMKLYDSVPASNVGKRKMVFYSIAELGSDRSVDFLADVARTGADPDLRREAVYYLGTIGGEKARTVLLEILGGR